MSLSDWITASGVLVALALGVYGVLRDRASDRERRRQQASMVVLTEHRTKEGVVLTVHNSSSGAVTRVRTYYVSISSQKHNVGDEVEIAQSVPFVSAASTEETHIHWREAEMSSGKYRVEFVDGNGHLWTRFSDGTLMDGSAGREVRGW